MFYKKEKEKGLNAMESPQINNEVIIAKTELECAENNQIYSKNELICNENKLKLSDFPSDMELWNSGNKELLAKKYATPFLFQSKNLQKLAELIFSHRASNFRQIEPKILHSFCAIIAFEGVDITPFFMIDLSDSGTGKSSNIKFQNEIIFEPVQLEVERNIEALEQDKNLKLPKKFLLGNEVSVSAIFDLLNSGCKTLYIVLSEMANILNGGNQLAKDFINFATDMYGQSTLYTPTFLAAKNLPPMFSNVKIFIVGDTNIRQIGSPKLVMAYIGGLLNRCIFTFTKDVLPFEQSRWKKPNKKDIEEFQKYIFNFQNFIKGIKKENQELDINGLMTNEIYIKYAKKIHAIQQNELISYKELYNRAEQNFSSIVQTLHYINEFERYLSSFDRENFSFNSFVEDETIKEGVEFFDYYLQSIHFFMQELETESLKITTYERRKRILSYVKEKLEKNDFVELRNIISRFPREDLTIAKLKELIEDFVEYDTTKSGKTLNRIIKIYDIEV